MAPLMTMIGMVQSPTDSWLMVADRLPGGRAGIEGAHEFHCFPKQLSLKFPLFGGGAGFDSKQRQFTDAPAGLLLNGLCLLSTKNPSLRIRFKTQGFCTVENF